MPNPSNTANNSHKIVAGVAWLVTLSWLNRILGFLSIFILARLLSPADFGVMALIMIAIQLTETLTNIGSEQYFIQKSDSTYDDLNCAWTSNLLIKLVASFLFALLSPVIAQAFNYSHLTPALLTISTLPFINALANGWIIKLKKELNYKNFFAVSTLSKLIANISAILTAWYFENYWALILGALLNAILYTMLSYLCIRQRATVGLQGWRKQFDFSKWVVLKGLVGHIRAKFDVWYASGVHGLTALGGYNFSKDLVLLPSREFLSPMSEVFFTAIATAKKGSEEQRLKIRKALTIIYLFAFPISMGWFLIAAPFTEVVLGNKWLEYVSIIQTLGLLVLTFSVGNFISHIMTALGHVKALFYYDLFTLLIALTLLFITSSYLNDITELALLRIFIGLVILLIGMIWLRYYKVLTMVEFIKPAIYPCIASIMMILSADWLTSSLISPFLQLVTIIIYSATLYSLLLVAGCRFNALGKLESQFVRELVNTGSQKIVTKIKHN